MLLVYQLTSQHPKNQPSAQYSGSRLKKEKIYIIAQFSLASGNKVVVEISERLFVEKNVPTYSLCYNGFKHIFPQAAASRF